MQQVGQKAHKLNLWARTGHSKEQAFRSYSPQLVAEIQIPDKSFFSSHGGGANYKGYPIFQIDGNFRLYSMCE